MIKGFLGSNSERGFYSYFENCMDYNKEGKLFILKGGSGSGKSTLIRKSIAFLQSLGLDCEEFYCSSDMESLDGAYCEALNMGIIDGTAPHVVDPKLYGVQEEIINMGDCLKCFSLHERREEIIALAKEKKQIYSTVYAYLGGAGKLFYDVCEKYDADILVDRLGLAAMELFESMQLTRENMVYPFYRKIFASAFTPSGYIDHTEQYQNYPRVYSLSGAFDNVYSNFLCVLSNYAKMFSSRMDLLMNPLSPEMISGVIIKDKGIVVLSESFIRNKEYNNAVKIDLSSCLKNRRNQERLNEQMTFIHNLTSLACKEMAMAKKKHEMLELLYRPHMDFEKVNGKIAEVITKIQTL